MCAAADVGPASAADQTREVFRDLIGALAAQGGTLRDDCVRTWLYIRDVDVFYQDMVKSRAEMFRREGLTGDTHFIASTGIEGACAHHYDLVAMDAYSVLGLAPGQMSYLNDFDHLCATKDYGVTFERATRVAYGDRAHIFMSGTASIDGEGWVVHPGDVLRQLDRALENVDALLADGEAQLADLTHLIVYLRDRGDYCRGARSPRRAFPGSADANRAGAGLSAGMADRSGGDRGQSDPKARLCPRSDGEIGDPSKDRRKPRRGRKEWRVSCRKTTRR